MSDVKMDPIAIVSPDTGAPECELELNPSDRSVRVPAAMYVAEAFGADGIKKAEHALLFRFRPTSLQRGKIALGEDLYLLMLVPNNRHLPIELHVGAGGYQLTPPKSPLVGLDGETPITEKVQLWTPDQGLPDRRPGD